MIPDIDVVIVYHRDENHRQALELGTRIVTYEDYKSVNVLYGSNKENNVGFGQRCNQVVFDQCTAPIVAFLNPDIELTGPFRQPVLDVFASDDNVRVTGERFNKPASELAVWGLSDWVCGAAMFVDRHWFATLGGFDSRFVWGWEETDFQRRTVARGGIVKSTHLPIDHPPAGETFDDADGDYKRKHFDAGGKLYFKMYPPPRHKRSRTPMRPVDRRKRA